LLISLFFPEESSCDVAFAWLHYLRACLGFDIELYAAKLILCKAAKANIAFSA